MLNRETYSRQKLFPIFPSVINNPSSFLFYQHHFWDLVIMYALHVNIGVLSIFNQLLHLSGLYPSLYCSWDENT